MENNDYNKVNSPPFPFITCTLIFINVLIFFISEFFGDTENAEYMLSIGASFPINIMRGQIWRLVSAIFLHFGFEHLINNMVMLGASGKILEEALGHFKFLVIYFIAGICGGLLSFFVMLISFDYAVAAGASGSIFGIVGALLWVVIINKGKFQTISTKGILFMIAIIVAYGSFTSHVDGWAHIGGLIAGFISCILLYRKKNTIILDY